MAESVNNTFPLPPKKRLSVGYFFSTPKKNDSQVDVWRLSNKGLPTKYAPMYYTLTETY